MGMVAWWLFVAVVIEGVLLGIVWVNAGMRDREQEGEIDHLQDIIHAREGQIVELEKLRGELLKLRGRME